MFNDFFKEVNKGISVRNKKEALKFFKKAIEFDPNNFEAFYLMGGTLYKLRKVKEAHLCFDIAVELSPNEHVAYKIKGNSLKAMKNFDIEIDF